MTAKESTTMYVDFAHVMRFNDVLQKAISEEYLRYFYFPFSFWWSSIRSSWNVRVIRFEPYLKNACKRFVMESRSNKTRQPITSDDNANKDICIAFYNIPLLKRWLLLINWPLLSVSSIKVETFWKLHPLNVLGWGIWRHWRSGSWPQWWEWWHARARCGRSYCKGLLSALIVVALSRTWSNNINIPRWGCL